LRIVEHLIEVEHRSGWKARGFEFRFGLDRGAACDLSVHSVRDRLAMIGAA
jgi:hypothetical protein